MTLVNDEDLEAVPNRRHRQASNNYFAYRFNFRMSCGINFENINVTPLGDLSTGVTGPTWVRVRPFSQLRARARMRAVVVLPTPRGPAKTNA